MQAVCSPLCAIGMAEKKRKKANEYVIRENRKADAERKAALATRSEILRAAQSAFNRYVRARDADAPCISCGKHHQGQNHAGHYLSTGARPELRFEELNVHKQCQPCNTHLHGNLILYRKNLIEKIGLDRVEWLEGPHEPKKYTREELIDIKQRYARMARELEKS